MPLAPEDVRSLAAANGLTGEEADVLQLLHASSYEDTVKRTGWSKGRIYALAKRLEARKTESLIRGRKQMREEYYQEVLGQTVRSDVLDFLRGLPSGKAQAFITSPPYGQRQKYGSQKDLDALHPVAYQGWLAQVLAEMVRVLAPGGVIFLQSGTTIDWQGHLMPIDVLMYETFRQLALEPQNRVVWVVPHGVTPKRSLARRYETALVWSKGPNAVFNPNAAATPQRQPGKRSYKAHNYGELTGRPLGAWPSDVWTDLPSVRYGHPEKTDHPAQFPLGLAMRATLLYTLPGQLVIDPFSGSGTVEEAARRTGRAFTGADLYYEDIRTARLANVEMDKSTPLPGISDEMVALWQAEAVRRDTPARPTTRPNSDR